MSYRMRRSTQPDSLFSADDLTALQAGPDFGFESRAMDEGFGLIAGLDEAGRGPLAGPVVAAAVILDPRNIPDGLDDSKALSAARRQELYGLILASSTVAIASASAAEIDRTDIRKASLTAMRRALSSLPHRAHYALIDGRDMPPGLHCPGKAVVKGDARSVSIAAASIVAKVTRDRMMTRACAVYPAYGFSSHMGYASVVHRTAIAQHGPCPLHRMTFRPLRQD
jgi:ribonuclease HII